jgi:murein DD-endopeptidase MepM/ murein hydrolase activator NlpD
MRLHRFAHLKDTPIVNIGDWVLRGQLIGFVGSTGNSTGPHLHYDIMEAATRPASYTSYIYGWKKEQVKAKYHNPAPYLKNGLPMENTFPKNGYGYLEWTGSHFHPGIDLNGVNDLGKPVYSPVEGRVVHILGTTWYRNAVGKWLSKDYNSGWGNLVVIEEKPGFKI